MGIEELLRAKALAVQATKRAGESLRANQHSGGGVLDDGGRDLKTQADRDAEQVILEALAPSGYPVLAEESGALGDVHSGGPVWVVDPLDGTVNFNRSIPFFGTSIALMVHGDPLLGVVYDIPHEELYSAVVGQGCWLNECPIRVSDTDDAAKAILATGLPTFRDHDIASLMAFAQDLRRFKKVRMLGSAALMLTQVAAGRIDAYQEDNIMLWDVAAGLALVKAAGGFVEVRPSETHRWGRNVRCSGHERLWED